MKGTYIGEFQEVVLLAILILDESAYGVKIQGEIQNRMKRSISRGALHTALTRLEEKGFIESTLGGATAARGGRSKRYYSVTKAGQQSLNEAKALRDEMWNLVPKLTN